ncbi:MAG: hypothetical protein ACK5NF_04300 [Bacilli bacterium]
MWAGNYRVYSYYHQSVHLGNIKTSRGFTKTGYGCNGRNVSKYVGTTEVYSKWQTIYGSKCLTP